MRLGLEIVMDFFFPRTDAGVLGQTIAALFIWAGIFLLTRKLRREYRVFILGLFFVNAGFFAFRTIH